jgi:hypothetical protein
MGGHPTTNMKKAFHLFLICLCQQIAFGQLPSSSIENLESNELKGKVRKVTTSSFKGKKVNGIIEKAGKGWQYTWENDEELIFDTLGLLRLKKVNKNGTMNRCYAIKLDANKRVVQLKDFNHITYFTYDSLNHFSSSRVVNEWGFQFESHKYYYDKKNNLIKEEEFDSDELICIKLYSYDTFNKLIKTVTLMEDDADVETYAYDKQHQLIKTEWINSEDGKIESTTYQYANKLKTKEHNCAFEDGVVIASNYSFFKNGDEIKYTETDEDGEIIEIEHKQYEYDDQGNWIKMTIDDNGSYFIVERTISYFDHNEPGNHYLTYLILAILFLGGLVFIGVWYKKRRK